LASAPEGRWRKGKMAFGSEAGRGQRVGA